jgi:hypothetical protein
MTEVFIICPARSTTGGPELCHQLADTLNTDQPGRAAVVYWPFDRGAYPVPAPYKKYDARPARRDEIGAGAIVVLPETYGRLLCDFPRNRVYYWWMSVNNFYRAAGTDAAIELAQIRRHAVANLYQSDYARLFCASAGLKSACRLSDRLSPVYLNAITKPPTRPRRDVVAFNPAKGMARTALIIQALEKGLRPAPKFVALQNLPPEQIRFVLSTAKLYIDFGEHPGKDRLPREAAAMGACVLTNRRGSAANPVDVPIPPEFKVDDRKRGWERRAAAAIHSVLDDFDNLVPRFDSYRAMIAAEPAQFVADARALFPVKVAA